MVSGVVSASRRQVPWGHRIRTRERLDQAPRTSWSPIRPERRRGHALEALDAWKVGDRRAFASALLTLANDPEKVRAVARAVALPFNLLLDVARYADVGDALESIGVLIFNEGGREREAIPYLLDAAEAGVSDAIGRLGDCLHWMGEFDEAIPWLERAIDQRDEMSDFLSSYLSTPVLVGRLGEALLAVGRDRDRALGLLRSAAETVPESGVLLAHEVLKDGEIEEARRLLVQSLEAGSREAPLLLGNLLSDEFDDTAGAMWAYRVGIERGDAHSAYNLAVDLADEGAVTEALELFATARRMGDMKHPPGWFLAMSREEP